MGLGLWIILVLIAAALAARGLLFSASLTRDAVKEFAFNEVTLPNGMRVNYKEDGDPDGRPMLLIHGGGDSLSVWQAWIAAFGTGYRFIAADLPGHGLTSPYPDGIYGTEHFAGFVAELVEALGLTDFVIVGHSFGGETVLRYVTAHPDAPAAMILSSPGGYSDENSLEMPRPVARVLQSGFGRIVFRKFGQRGLFARLQYAKFFRHRNEITEAAIDRQYTLFRYEMNRGVLLSLVSYEALHHRDVTGLGDVICPALFILGREDRIVSLTAGLRMVADTPDAEHVIYEDMGHMSHIEIAAQNAGDARAFLNRHNLG